MTVSQSTREMLEMLSDRLIYYEEQPNLGSWNLGIFPAVFLSLGNLHFGPYAACWGTRVARSPHLCMCRSSCSRVFAVFQVENRSRVEFDCLSVKSMDVNMKVPNDTYLRHVISCQISYYTLETCQGQMFNHAGSLHQNSLSLSHRTHPWIMSTSHPVLKWRPR